MPIDDHRPPHRRDVLKGMLATSVSAASAGSPALLAPTAAAGPDARRDPELIRRENERPGTADWQLTRVRTQPRGGYRSPWIEGYCDRQSVEAGQTLRIMVSTDPPRPFTLELFRMGYYGGDGARLMKTLGPLPGKKQPEPEAGRDRPPACRWDPAAEITIPQGWPSGVYLGRLTREPKRRTEAPWQSYVIFIVRDRRPADVLFQCSDNTWQAYNRWPDNDSLYTHPDGALVGGVSVSFDRPYGKYVQIYDNPQSVGSGEFLCWEYPLCYWLEKHGYDVTYASNSDMLDVDAPHGPARCKAFISVGHDEYWDLRQYRTIEAARDRGTSLLFLSGNSVCFVSPFENSPDGRAKRVISRAGTFGEMTDAEAARMGPFETVGPDESRLVGARTIIPFNGGGDWIATRPDHWVFEGTGMKKGEGIPGLVGWEFHGDPAEIEGLEVIAEGTALSGGVEPAHWTSTIYPGPRGNFVFNAATIWWAQGLSRPPGHMLPWSHWTRPHGPDARVQRMTHNLLKRAIGGGKPSSG